MKNLFIVLFGIAIVLGIFTLSSWLFQIVWNLVPAKVFYWPTLTLIQSMGIVFLLGFIGKAFQSLK